MKTGENTKIQPADKRKTDPAKAAKRSARRASFRDTMSLSILAIPGFFLLLVFNYIPMGGIIIAFKNFKPLKGIFGSDWCGLDNFEFFFTSQDAVRTIRNTLGYSVLFIIVGMFCSVSLALMFYSLRNRRALKFYNTVMIMPKFMSPVIIAFIVYVVLHPSLGLLNNIIRFFGGENIKWYSDAKYWPYILTITQVWRSVGMASIIYYASLMGLDEGLIEAAKLDGANKWHQIRHVLIPHLVPTMVINTILNIGQMFSGDFGLFYQVPMNKGQLYGTTDIINTYVYRAMTDGSLAKSAAIGLFQSAAGLVMVLITNAIVRKVSPENSLY